MYSRPKSFKSHNEGRFTFYANSSGKHDVTY